jgi:hypothetical protein
MACPSSQCDMLLHVSLKIIFYGEITLVFSYMLLIFKTFAISEVGTL